MKLDRDSNMPLYMQFKNILTEKIRSGELKPGSIMKTELELCSEYEISRYPVRQAMEELVAEGYLNRTRGKGTFVSNELPNMSVRNGKTLGLILPNMTAGFNGQILPGFEKQARKRGYLTIACCSEGSIEEEMNCLDMMSDNGVSGIFVFPCDDSKISSRADELKSSGIYLGLMDRNPGMQDVDYIGSDNFGGVYSGVRHLALQGFRNVSFIADRSFVSSVRERLEGYEKAVEDFGLNSVAQITTKGNAVKIHPGINRTFIEELQEEITRLKVYLPLGIFVVNDFLAIECMNVCESEGLIIGKDVAIVGFDNIPEGNYQKVPLTTVAQNGLLLGHTAADMAIDKLERKANQVYRSIIPTQLVVRCSCGEKL